MLPTKLYWILFPINDLREAVEMAKRIITKEKIVRQLSGQYSCTPFMGIRDSHNRKVSFDTKEELGDKIDKLAVMIGKLAARDSEADRQFKSQIYQGRGRGQNRHNYDRCSYDQQSYKQDIDEIVETEDNIDRTAVGIGMNKIIGEIISEVI